MTWFEVGEQKEVQRRRPRFVAEGDKSTVVVVYIAAEITNFVVLNDGQYWSEAQALCRSWAVWTCVIE